MALDPIPYVVDASGDASAAPEGAVPIALYGADSGGVSTVAWDDVTDKPTTFAPTIGTTATTAKAGNAVQTATQTTATAISPGTATNVQGILAELAARITALETAP